MLKNMSIKLKLILSFVTISILVATLAIYNIVGLNKATDGFSSYRELARDSLLASRVQGNMLMMRMQASTYLREQSQNSITEFDKYYKTTTEFLEVAKKEINNPKRMEMVSTIVKQLRTYNDDFYKVIEFIKDRNEIVNNNLNINGKKIEQALTAIMKSAEEDNKNNEAINTSHSIRLLLLARLYVVKFLNTNKKEDISRAKEEFSLFRDDLNKLKNIVSSTKRIKLSKETITLVSTYLNGLDKLVTIIDQRNSIIHKSLVPIGVNIASLAEDIKLSIKDEQDIIGPMVAKLNKNLTHISLIVSILIIIAVILFSITIPMSISKALTRLDLGILKLLNSGDVKIKS